MRRALFSSILILLISTAASASGLSDAMDTSLIFETGGDAVWFSQARPYFFGYDSAQSGDIGNNQVSWMRTTVCGPGTLSFYWKVSSERHYDDLKFFIDGVLQDRISEIMDWHQMTYEITTSGVHTLEWRYVKDHSKSEGDDCGWVDYVEWSGEILPSLVSPLCEALDTSLNLTTGGEAEWFSQKDTSFFGGAAAQSGNIGDNQESYLQMTVDGTGTICFCWKVSSEENYDCLEFYIDGVLQDQISGLVDWHQMVYTINEPGTHILEWRYVKDNSIERGDDCGWVDRLEWSGEMKPAVVGPLSEALDTNLHLTTGGEADWFSQTGTSFFGGDSAQSGNIGDNQESYLQMTVEGPGTISFYWQVSSEENYDYLEFYIDGVLQDRISGTEHWRQMMYKLTGLGMHTIEWRYVKDFSLSEQEDCGWVDQLEWSDGSQLPSGGPLSEALDTSLNLSTSGDAEWLVQMDTSFFDGDAAQSGVISDNQESLLQTTINGAGMLRFYWKVSSEENYDYLGFYIDGVLQDRISGSEDWRQMVYTINESGAHTLEWRYIKDSSIDRDNDCGWVDKLEWLYWDWEGWWIEIR